MVMDGALSALARDLAVDKLATRDNLGKHNFQGRKKKEKNREKKKKANACT